MFLKKKSEVKSSFIRWYYNASVLSSLHPSTAWDEKMVDPTVDIAIASSKEVKQLCKETEAQITTEYTDLLDFNVRAAFQKLKRNDIANPGGFSDIGRASPELTNYFQCRKIFDQFIADDVTEHSNKESQVHAFTRWVSIANLLLKRHNYDAASLVLLRLSQIEMRLHLEKALPEDTQKKLNHLNQFIFPSKNFKVLRDYMKSHHSKYDLPPTFLISKDMTFLNEALGDDKNLKSKDITKTHPSYRMIVLKERALEQLFNEKQQAMPKKKCSARQAAMFERICDEYLLMGDDNPPTQAKRQKKSADVIPLTNAELSLSDNSPSDAQGKLTKEPELTKEAGQEIPKTEKSQAEQKQTDNPLRHPKNHAQSLFKLSFFSRSECYTQEVIRTVAPYLKF